jgi:hypothetical protein
MKLTIDLVPLTCVKNTLHNQIRTRTWEKLCKKVEKQQRARCGICGKASTQRKPLYFQEMWEYNDLVRTQKLTGLQALCSLCHSTKNIEQARLLAQRGDLDMKAIGEHFCRVNACTREEFQWHEAEVRRTWKRRSRQKQWNTSFGDYAHLLPAAAEEREAQGCAPHLHRTKKRKPQAMIKAAIRHKEKVTGYIRQRKKKGR